MLGYQPHPYAKYTTTTADRCGQHVNQIHVVDVAQRTEKKRFRFSLDSAFNLQPIGQSMAVDSAVL